MYRIKAPSKQYLGNCYVTLTKEGRDTRTIFRKSPPFSNEFINYMIRSPMQGTEFHRSLQPFPIKLLKLLIITVHSGKLYDFNANGDQR